MTSAKIADGAVATADLAAKAVTTAKLGDGAVGKAQLADWAWVGAISDFGQLYTCGRMGLILIYCKKTAALGAWSEISATLPGGVKSKYQMAASLTCEDHAERSAIALVDGATLKIQNRSGTAWAASTTGFYLRGQLLFPLA